MIPSKPLHHYTQLSLITQLLKDGIFKISSIQPHLKLYQPCLNVQKDLFTCWVAVPHSEQQPKKIEQKQGSSNKKKVLDCRLYHLKALQIQKIITFYLVEYCRQFSYVDDLRNISDMRKLQGKKVLVDTFWICIQGYFPKRLNTTYLQTDLKPAHLQKLKQIIEKRLILKFKQTLPLNNNQKNEQQNLELLLRVLSKNYMLMNKFLSVKDYQHLLMTNVTIYRAFHQQEEYKCIYEDRWGRTGFGLNERNWIKAYENKVKKLKK